MPKGWNDFQLFHFRKIIENYTTLVKSYRVISRTIKLDVKVKGI